MGKSQNTEVSRAEKAKPPLTLDSSLSSLILLNHEHLGVRWGWGGKRRQLRLTALEKRAVQRP